MLITQPQFTVPRPKTYEGGYQKQGKRQHLATFLTNFLSKSLFHNSNSEALGTKNTHVLWILFNLVSLTFVLICWFKITCNNLYHKEIINYSSHTVSENKDSPIPISSARIIPANRMVWAGEQDLKQISAALYYFLQQMDEKSLSFLNHNLFHKVKGISNPLLPLQLWSSSLSG